jgi:hypothetical protein
LESFVIMGCSAGALGAQAWANEALRQIGDTIGFANAAVVPDSYVGVFPPDSQGDLIRGFGACGDNGAFVNSPALITACNGGTLTLQEITDTNMKANPEITFAFVNSKKDTVQKLFYAAIGITTGVNPVITNPAYYGATNTIFAGYLPNNNGIEYIVDSDTHCYTNKVRLTAHLPSPRPFTKH